MRVSTASLLLFVASLPLLAGCAALRKCLRCDSERRIVAVDSGGRPIQALEVGSSLEVTAEELQPRSLYEFRLTLVGSSGEATLVTLARASSDSLGRIAPFILWYHSGVIGCATRPIDEKRPVKFRSFDEAEQALRGRTLRIRAHEVGDDAPEGALPKASDEAILDLAVPIEVRRSPMVYSADASGCLVNSLMTQGGDLWVAGRHFDPGQLLAVSIVPNQRAWYVGDGVVNVTGSGSTRVTADASGRFRVRLWEAANQRHGVYDIVAQPITGRALDLERVDRSDIVSYGSDSAVVLFLRYPVGGPTMDLAGRPLLGFPYFEYADSFAETGDAVAAATDPTYVPTTHPGGLYAGYIVVAHRPVNGWDPMAGGSIAISDITGGVEVMPVKAGCINATDTVIWPEPVPVGQYDVVVDFGLMPAATEGMWATDNQYDSAIDFLDGADQIGFVVTKDPYELGSTPIGAASYSFDDALTIGSVLNVDLRAVVRYPATMAGTDTPVAPGVHPLFVIEHGNHSICRICTDGTLWYDRLKQAYRGTIAWSQFGSLCSHTHTTCPVAERIRNHEGYTRLLEILASHGIIAVSIDAFDLSGPVPGYISERADLILRHVEMWAHLNNASAFPTYPEPFAGRFNGHVDLTKISVSGHSRGGEASVRAYLKNQALPLPFGINSVSSIAPVDFHGAVLPNVPYFVILPAADGDVSDLNGARIYDRAGSTISDATTKSGIDVYGANHNFFNTVWAADFDDYADAEPTWPPRADMIPATDQQRLGDAYLAAFARVNLKGETVYEDMLRGRLTFPSTAGRKIHHFRHEPLHSKLDGGSGALGAPSGGATKTAVVNPSVHQTQALQLSWPSATGMLTYAVPLAQQDASAYEVLSFRAAQINSAANPVGDQDFQVELQGGGKTLAVYLGKFDQVPKPYSRPDAQHSVMTTVRIPLHSFIVNRSGVKLEAVDTIRFKFTSPATGDIYVDDVEFSR